MNPSPTAPGDQQHRRVSIWNRLRGALNFIYDYLMGYDVFVSYVWEEGRAYALSLQAALQSKKYRCFLDSSELVTGADLIMDVSVAARRSRALIVVVTANALVSNDVRREIGLFDSASKQIVPIDVRNALYQPLERRPGSIVHEPSANLARLLGPDSEQSGYDKQEIENAFLKIARERRLQVEESSPLEPSAKTVELLCNSFDFTRKVHRRMRAIAVTCLVLVGLTIAATLAMWYANIQRRRAEETLADALRVSNLITEQVDVKLNDVPGAEAVRESLLDSTYGMLQALMKRTSNTARVDVERAMAATNLGNWNFRHGSLQSALTYFQQSLELDSRTGGDVQSRVRDLLNLGRAYRDLSQYDAATKCYDQAELAAGQIAGGDRSRRQVAAALYGKADVLLDTANRQEALALHKRAEEMRKQIIGQLPPTESASLAEALLDYAASADRVGHIAGLLGDRAAQRQAHGDSHACLMKLVAMHPENGQYQRDAALAISRLGYDALEDQAYPQAEAHLQDAEQRLGELVRRAPISKTYRYDWAIALSDLGDLNGNGQKFDIAKQRYDSSLQQLEKVIQDDPQNVTAAGQRIATLNAYADMLFKIPDADTALKYYNEALRFTDKSIRKWPALPNLRLGKGMILSSMSDVTKSSDPAQSRVWLNQAHSVLEELCKEYPKAEEYAKALQALPLLPAP